MNYIEQIKGFWRSHDLETFPANAIALYFYLLEVNNKASWMVSFKRNNSKICADLGISYPTLNISRNRLKQAGLIEFKTQNGNPNVTYSLKDFLKVCDEVSNEVTTEVTIEVSNEVSDAKDKLKHKTKTKTKVIKENKENFSDKLFEVEEQLKLPWETETFKVQWQLWKVYKLKEHKFNYKTTISEQAALNKLSNLAGNDEKKAIAIIKEAIAHGWSGLFQIKDYGKSANNTGTNHGNGYRVASVDTGKLVADLTKDIEDGNIPGQY